MVIYGCEDLVVSNKVLGRHALGLTVATLLVDATFAVDLLMALHVLLSLRQMT